MKAEKRIRVPLIKPDLPPFDAVEGALREILESGRITNFGSYVTEFEAEAAAYLDAHVVTVSSGTLGLILTLQALGVERGQKVVLPSFTFMATAQAVLYAAGVPVFAEVEDDLTMSPADLRGLLDRHGDVAAVLPVHTYGLPCRTDEIQRAVEEAARRRGRPIPVLYDAAHAFGSAANGRKVGTFGAAEVFSLSVTKVLVSVEGGMVASRDADLIGRLRKMRNYGIEENYDAGWPGLNGKMSELHALIGLYNLRRLEALLAARQRLARTYGESIRTRTGFRTIPSRAGVTHTFKDFTVVAPEPLADRRDKVIAFLEDHGVEARAYFFPPVHEQRFFRRFADRPLARTEALARRVITLPFYSSMTEAEMDHVVTALGEAEKGLA